jgi:nucleotide-binding universal stress UspA family protein
LTHPQRDAEQIEAGLRNDGSLVGIKLDIEVSVGPVWTTIAGAIEDRRSAALVLGTHGRAGLRKLALGSVAESAFREAACPVMTVGPKVLRSKSSGAEAKHFLVPTDLSPESLEALPYGVSLAGATGGDLTLLHVLKSKSGDGKRQAESVREVEARFREFLQLHPRAENQAHFLVEAGPPAEVIVRVAERDQTDIIIMGLRAWAVLGKSSREPKSLKSLARTVASVPRFGEHFSAHPAPCWRPDCISRPSFPSFHDSCH